MTADVTADADCRRAVEACVAAFGAPRILVNSAGIIRRTSILETPEAEWDLVMAVNVKSVYLVGRHAIPPMVAAGGGAIVNVGSGWGLAGGPRAASYCASKGAVHNLTRALALDHATDGIRVNAVCPGEVRTPMLQSQRSEPVTQALLDRIAATVPMGRLAEPIEIARVVAFLASDAASYMTGALVSVDAGYGAR